MSQILFTHNFPTSGMWICRAFKTSVHFSDSMLKFAMLKYWILCGMEALDKFVFIQNEHSWCEYLVYLSRLAA